MVAKAQALSGSAASLQEARSRGFLSRLSNELVDDLVENAHRVEYPEGAVILRWEDSATCLIVLRGTLRSFLADETGRQVTVRYLRAGDVVGLVPETQIPATRGLQVLEECEMLVLSQRHIKELIGSDTVFASAAVEEVASIMSAALGAFYLRSFGTVRQRVANAILERAALSDHANGGRTVAGTQHDLAMAVGTVREVVASTLQSLKRQGLIRIRRREVAIVDPQGLARAAGRGSGPRGYGWDGAGGAPSSSNMRSST